MSSLAMYLHAFACSVRIGLTRSPLEVKGTLLHAASADARSNAVVLGMMATSAQIRFAARPGRTPAVVTPALLCGRITSSLGTLFHLLMIHLVISMPYHNLLKSSDFIRYANKK